MTRASKGIAGLLVILLASASAQEQRREERDLVPLTELGRSTYRGESGGLYGEGSNEVPAPHLAAARTETSLIQPLDSSGKPSSAGKIVLLALGMSNTHQAFLGFRRLADKDREKSPRVILVSGAQGGMDATCWTDPKQMNKLTNKPVWQEVDDRLGTAGCTASQVQVLWIKQAHANPAQYGEFPAHARRMQDDLLRMVQLAKERYPNVRIAYLSSRTYAGYAKGRLNPEPYAYEGAFSVRWLIQAQIQGDPRVNFDPQKGAVKAPILLWGPYLWAAGTTPRKDDHLAWRPEDVMEKDGVHESESGQRKTGEMLLKFFLSDPLARNWFRKSEGK